MRPTQQQGIAALPTLLILGGLVTNIAIVVTLGVFLVVSSGYEDRLAAEALAAARGGIQDGMLHVARDKNFSSNYNLTIGGRSVNIDVCKDTCSGNNKTQITAIGNAITRQRKLVATLNVSSFGEIQLESLQEVPL